MEIWQFCTFVDQEIGNFALRELHRRRNLAFLLIGVIGFSWLAPIYCHLAAPYATLVLMTTIIEYKQNHQTKQVLLPLLAVNPSWIPCFSHDFFFDTWMHTLGGSHSCQGAY